MHEHDKKEQREQDPTTCGHVGLAGDFVERQACSCEDRNRCRSESAERTARILEREKAANIS